MLPAKGESGSSTDRGAQINSKQQSDQILLNKDLAKMKTMEILLAFIAVFTVGVIFAYTQLGFLENEEVVNILYKGSVGSDAHVNSSKMGLNLPWAADEQMSVLVCGGLSFLGYQLTVTLLAQGHSVTVVDRFYDEHHHWPDAHLARLRLQHLEQMNSLEFSFINSDPCDLELAILRRRLNLGLISHVVFVPEEYGHEGEAWERHRFASQRVRCLVRTMESLTTGSLISSVYFTLLSSTTVYDIAGSSVADESSVPLTPQSTSTILQLQMEMIAHQYHMSHNLSVFIARLSNVYGPWMNLQHNLVKLAHATLQGTNDQLTWSIQSVGISRHMYIHNQDFIYVNDAVQCVILGMSERFQNEVINVGSETVNSYLKMHDMMYKWLRDKAATSKSNQPFSYSKDLKLNYFTGNNSTLIYPLVNCSKAQHLLSFRTNFTHNVGIEFFMQWLISAHQVIFPTGKNDLVFASLFTTKPDPQRKVRVRQNNFAYMQNWYWSVCDTGLSAVVFHDSQSDSFKARIQGENVIFKLTSLGSRTTNDARFYVYLDYLIKNPSIQRVYLTDLADVTFQRNPFQLMDVLGDHLYIGTDIELFPKVLNMGWLVRRLWECFNSKQPRFHNILDYRIVYNAGVIGGSRTIMLEFLERLVTVLDLTPTAVNCNMAAVNYVAHTYFADRVYTGFPLTSRFWKWQRNPKAVYIIHK